jgi:hypothetical protein
LTECRKREGRLGREKFYSDSQYCGKVLSKEDSGKDQDG